MTKEKKLSRKKRFGNIVWEIKHNKNIGLNLLKEYINDYPDDIYGVTFYTRELYKLGEYEEALDILNNYPKCENKFLVMIYREKIYALYALGKYSEVLDVIKKLQDIENIGGAIAFIKNKCLLLIDDNENVDEYDESFYVFNQSLKYDKDKALDHIIRHKSRINKKNKPIYGYFNDDIDVYELIEELEMITKYSDVDQKAMNLITDLYYFYYPNIGYVNGEKTNYMKVITIKGTTNIINAMPCYFARSRVMNNYFQIKKKYIIEPDEIEESSPRVKKLSQIEKFNARYGIKY